MDYYGAYREHSGVEVNHGERELRGTFCLHLFSLHLSFGQFFQSPWSSYGALHNGQTPSGSVRTAIWSN
jgi:hypothetical protein